MGIFFHLQFGKHRDNSKLVNENARQLKLPRLGFTITEGKKIDTCPESLVTFHLYSAGYRMGGLTKLVILLTIKA